MAHYYEISYSQKRWHSVRNYRMYIGWYKDIVTEEDKQELEKSLKDKKDISRKSNITEVRPISEYFFNKITGVIELSKALF